VEGIKINGAPRKYVTRRGVSVMFLSKITLILLLGLQIFKEIF